MRMQQFKLPRAEGDREDAELALFFFRGNAGSVQDNLARQEKKFEIPAGKKAEDVIKVEKIKLGGQDAVYQDIQGTYLKKAGGRSTRTRRSPRCPTIASSTSSSRLRRDNTT